MANGATGGVRARAPHGAKRVAQSFLDELGTIAEDKQPEVAKAAQAMIREALVARREKAKSAKAKVRARTSSSTTGRTRVRAVRGRNRSSAAANPAEPTGNDTQEKAEAGET